MANNRLYMGCKKCRKFIYLDKHFGTPFYISEKKCKEINDFFDEHFACEESDWAMTVELFDEMGSNEKFDYYFSPLKSTLIDEE